MSSLKDKVAIITGASSGLGAATAEHFARLGCFLSLTGRDEQNLATTKFKCLEAGLKESQVLITKGDVTSEADMKNLVDATIKKFSRVDVLVNNAGILSFGDLASSPMDVYDKMMSINVRSVVFLTKLCLPHLEKSKGAIVNVSSVCGPRSYPGIIYYSMSKSAIDQLTKCAALELAPMGIRVNAIAPGLIVTQLHRRGGVNEKDFAEFVEKGQNLHPLQRNGRPIEAAKAVAFLASDESSFTTGEVLPVDGGRNIMTY